MTLKQLKNLRGLGDTVPWLETGEWGAILDLATWALQQKAKAAARVAKHRGKPLNRAKPVPSRAQSPAKPPKATQNGRNRAKRGLGATVRTVLAMPESQMRIKDGKDVPLSGPGLTGKEGAFTHPDLARHLHPQFKTTKNKKP